MKDSDLVIKDITLKFIKPSGGYMRKRCLHLCESIGLEGLSKTIHKDIVKILKLKKAKIYHLNTKKVVTNLFFNEKHYLIKELCEYGHMNLIYDNKDRLIEKRLHINDVRHAYRFYLRDNKSEFTRNTSRIIKYTYNSGYDIIRVKSIPIDNNLKFCEDIWYDNDGNEITNKTYGFYNRFISNWRDLIFTLFYKINTLTFWRYRKFIKSERSHGDDSFTNYI